MDDVSFELFVGYPPNEAGPIVELLVHRGPDAVDVPASLRQVEGQAVVTVHRPSGGTAWEFPANAFIEALQRAARALDDPSERRRNIPKAQG
jgi:hypothetical protein